MTLFAQSLRAGELPAWIQGFANYGYPLPLIAHQLPAYTGAVLILLGQQPENAFALLVLLTTCLSGIGMYFFLRQLVDIDDHLKNPLLHEGGVLAGAIVWTFSSYRIMNIYSRGALPELFWSAIAPFALLSLLLYLKVRRSRYLCLFSLSMFALAITHPMMLAPTAVLLAATFISGILTTTWRDRFITFFTAGTGAVLGIVAGSYYLLPLMAELKYFYQGAGTSSIGAESFVTLHSAFVWHWPYFPPNDHPGPRIGPIQIGTIEFGLVVSAVGVALYQWATKKQRSVLFIIWMLTAVVGLFLSSLAAKPLYDSVDLLSSLQFPWRFLSAFHFATAVLAALLTIRLHIPRWVVFTLLILVIGLRLPEAYGKNFVSLPASDYLFNRENLHSTNLNPVWVGETKDYPLQNTLFSIIEGSGDVETVLEKSSNRHYRYTTTSPLRVSFNTFYFPGWHLFLDTTPVLIEYQDPNYRGVMTARLPEGSHEILLEYSDTKIREWAKYISLLSLLVIGPFVWFSLYLDSRIRT